MGLSHKVFVEEIKQSKILQLIYYFILFSFILTFGDWFNREYFTAKSVQEFTAVCWPHFKNCTDLYFFNAIPEGYSLGVLYSIVGGILFTSLYFALKERWGQALLFLLPLVLFKFVGLYFLSYLPTGNYTVLELFIALVFIFSKYKIYALKILVTVFYLLSFTIKFHHGYFTGNIFSSLSLGVPFFSDTFISFYGVTFTMLVGVLPILLWSKNRLIRNFSIYILVLFHIYSIILVGFRYPFICISLHFLLFLNSPYEQASFKKIRNDYITLFTLTFLLIMQSIPILIKGDEKITNEGQKYGFYMFDANRQCISNMSIFYKDGTISTSTYKNNRGMFRCDPYQEWFETHLRCKNNAVDKIAWTFDSSINGSSYFSLVNVGNACEISYKAFKHNDWIKEGVKNTDIKVFKNSF